MRIVSLLPSATEIVCALGLEPCLVGITHECDYPVSIQSLPRVTRTLIPGEANSAEIDARVREQLSAGRALYTLDYPTLEALRPDLIVTQALCDVCAVSEAEVTAAACSLPGRPRVLNLEPMTLDAVFDSMLLVGNLTGRAEVAGEVVHRLRARTDAVAARTKRISPDDRLTVAFLEWLDPLFTGGHWNPALVSLAGGVDIFGRTGQPSRTLPWEDFVAARPQVVFAACCGFPVARTVEELPALTSRVGWNELPAVMDERVYVADGSAYFSRPGPRLVEGLEILAHCLYPLIHPSPAIPTAPSGWRQLRAGNGSGKLQ